MLVDVSHKTRKEVRAGDGSGLFLLPDKKGGYALLGDESFSHFCGAFHFLPREWTLFKSVDAISLDEPPVSVRNKLYTVVRNYSSAKEEFFMFNNTLFYQVKDYSGNITIDLDMRRVYEDDPWGREYRVYREDGCVVVEYSKAGESWFLVVRGVGEFESLDEWVPRHYAYDASRGEVGERWVYRALRVPCSGSARLSFTLGRDKESLLRESGSAWGDWGLIRGRLRRFALSIPTTNGVAYSAAVFALESLVVSLPGSGRRGVFAGLPWFFQFWSRDELVSVEGLLLAEKYALVKEVLMRYAHAVLPDGRIPNRVPGSSLGSADAVGWLWRRVGDTVRHLESRKLLWEYFSKADLAFLADRLEESLEGLRRSRVRDGFVVNDPGETWMDTLQDGELARGGVRVEVQALTLASVDTLRLLRRVLKRPRLKWLRSFSRSLLRRVQDVLVEGGVLHDGFDGGLDVTVRPNVFLAAYVFPDLVSRDVWRTTFDRALKVLWLDWGGLASLDRRHWLFVPWYSGADDRSYHRGDSWFWVNNLAAVAMEMVDPRRYRYHVHEISRASVRDLLWCGVVGQCSEVSSAAEQDASGCLAQAWSAASLVELLSVLGVEPSEE
ncbi:MAG: amylo-alpha-1,6-glucosidase [Candidatus Woesearchaeota archaeon]